MSGLFDTDVQPAPKPEPPPPMPDEFSPGVIEARRRAGASILNRSGRSSTILAKHFASSSASANYDTFDRGKLGAA